MKKVNFDQIEIEGASQKGAYFSIFESLLFVSGEPIKLRDLALIIEGSENFTEDILHELMIKYEAEERGIRLININNEYQLVTKPQNSYYVQKLLKTNIRQSLSQAALETLAIVSYRQPITRIDIDNIRGVKSDSAVLTLVDKGLIKECGRMDVAGRPILYATTEEFLKNFGLNTIKDMPSLENLMEGMMKDELLEQNNEEELYLKESAVSEPE
ncbi:MAG: segregation/condensation protein B [Clostridiaceae bacterium]|nr:segregation/condensation protein B [Clostridiaceae bacterium]